MATIVANEIYVPPRHAPGQGVAEALNRSIQYIISDEIALADTSPATAIKVYNGTRVIAVLVEITEVFDGDATITAGDGDDADGYMTDAEIGSDAVGIESSWGGAQPYAAGKRYTADDTIDITIASTTGTTGKCKVHVLYLPPLAETFMARTR